jgi:hypothetical protein
MIIRSAGKSAAGREADFVVGPWEAEERDSRWEDVVTSLGAATSQYYGGVWCVARAMPQGNEEAGRREKPCKP